MGVIICCCHGFCLKVFRSAVVAGIECSYSHWADAFFRRAVRCVVGPETQKNRAPLILIWRGRKLRMLDTCWLGQSRFKLDLAGRELMNEIDLLPSLHL